MGGSTRWRLFCPGFGVGVGIDSDLDRDSDPDSDPEPDRALTGALTPPSRAGILRLGLLFAFCLNGRRRTFFGL